jgi:large subunit ribosomal protein L32
MAVPKKKTSTSKKNMRRSHDALKPINVAIDSKTGEYKLPHHISLKDGFYKGRQVVKVKALKNNSDEE